MRSCSSAASALMMLPASTAMHSSIRKQLWWACFESRLCAPMMRTCTGYSEGQGGNHGSEG